MLFTRSIKKSTSGFTSTSLIQKKCNLKKSKYATQTATQEATTASTGGFGVTFGSPTWVKFVGDLIATEAEIPVPELNAQNLKTLYGQQLANLQNNKETLLKEKVSESAYQRLLDLYQLRASFPLETIEKALEVGGVNDMQKRGFKGTIGASFPNNEDDIDDNAIPSGVYARYKLAKTTGVPFKLTYPKNFFSGVSGLLKALHNGFTTEQLSKSKSLLSSDSGEIIQMDKPNELIKFSGDNYAQRVEMIRAGNWEAAFPRPEGMNEEETKNYEKFIAQQKAFWANPNAEAQIELVELTANSDAPNSDKVAAFLSAFEDKSVANNEDQIRRFYIFNPVGEALLRNNIVALDAGHVIYTEDFSEYSGGKLRYGNPGESKGRKDWNETTAIMNANVGFGDPKVAGEQIMELKMDRLAGFYGLNLDNELDNLKFHVFMDQYEISPGESGLDWLMTYPPDHHTFDELPIVKIPSDEDVEDYYKQ